MKDTKIEWCDTTLNPVVGCTFSCSFCYAKRMNKRFKWVDDFECPKFFPERLKKLKSRVPKSVFMDSMSDVADWKPEWRREIFDAIIKNPQHRYILLSKRPAIYHHLSFDDLYEKVGDTVWIGTSVCRREDEHRTFQLYMSHNFLCSQFLSIEPILEPINPECVVGFSWVILGAETGKRKGKIVPNRKWINDITDVCREYGIPVFMKNSLIPVVGKENLIQEYPDALAFMQKAA